MFAWMGKLIGTEKAVDNILDKDNGHLAKVGGWIGSFNYTDEEKAEADAQTREWGIRQLDALAPFKVVQRILAFSTSAFWVFVGLNCVAALWVEALWPEIKIADRMLKFAFSDYVLWPVLAVFSLYFTGGVVNSIKNKSKETN